MLVILLLFTSNALKENYVLWIRIILALKESISNKNISSLFSICIQYF